MRYSCKGRGMLNKQKRTKGESETRSHGLVSRRSLLNSSSPHLAPLIDLQQQQYPSLSDTKLFSVSPGLHFELKQSSNKLTRSSTLVSCAERPTGYK